MPLSSTCRNCGSTKTMDYYAENYCKECSDQVTEAKAEADKHKADAGAAVRNALASRASITHKNKVDPRFPLTKSDYWGAKAPQEAGGVIVILLIVILIAMLAPVFMMLPPE